MKIRFKRRRRRPVRTRRYRLAMEKIDRWEQCLYQAIDPEILSTEEICELQNESVYNLCKNPEPLLLARIDYLALPDTTRHLICCIINGQGEMQCSGHGPVRKYNDKQFKEYVCKLTGRKLSVAVLRKARKFFDGLSIEQLNDIEKIIV